MNMKENKQQKAYRIIKSRIVERVYAPGQRLVIDQLAKELASSSIPIREAIRQLEAERLVHYQKNVGPIVARVNESEYLESIKLLAVLEGYATALSAQHYPPEKLLMLKDKNKRMKEALAEFDFLIFAKMNSEFHMLIYEECGNNMLIATIKDLWEKLDTIRGPGSMLYSVRVKESIQEHEIIIEFLKNQAPFAEVEATVRKHKLATAADFERRRTKSN
ncbi:GntR family transcriptional regulator [Bacillus sp. FJAT-50079]|uniref:GntR family transcriptional regulator n=1 Tax=Bacillus sp. FJAT-50079 TaxID=2833577 RepID=UPI001BC8FB0F|nr:GntR family transcriptional regulator [Bacillus sp. FJAT-50079]MBS4210254.1 GntR family transcriptional regulator [Bacillus sp. FJAT-50079]